MGMSDGILIEQNYKQRYAGFDPRSSESYIMFELLQDKNMSNSVELAKMIQREACALTGRQNKGVHQAGFLVLRETSMPSCLIELGFISTPDEEQYLNSATGQDQLAHGIFNAFVKYKNKYGGGPSSLYSMRDSLKVELCSRFVPWHPLLILGHIQTESEGMEKDSPCKWKSTKINPIRLL